MHLSPFLDDLNVDHQALIGIPQKYLPTNGKKKYFG